MFTSPVLLENLAAQLSDERSATAPGRARLVRYDDRSRPSAARIIRPSLAGLVVTRYVHPGAPRAWVR